MPQIRERQVPTVPAVVAVSPCLAPDDFLAYVEGCSDVGLRERILQHLDDCSTCRVMMAEAARVIMNTDSPDLRREFHVLSTGEQVGGRYEVRRFIARGGMGEVYEAADTALKERVALKTLAITSSDRDDAADGLLREVRIARKVSHPNVCRILELGIHRAARAGSMAVPFLTMEFLTGETLGRRLSRDGPLPPKAVLRIVAGLAAGLGAVHKAGIVHRDLKSENVFLAKAEDQSERTVVMDFGLARVYDAASIRGSTNGRFMIGTPAYMAPEQLTGKPATPASDIYALGIVTFEMLTGRLPFDGDTPASLALSRLHQAPLTLLSILPDLDPRWEAVVGRCLESSPKNRFGSVDEFEAAIGRMTSEAPIVQRRWREVGAVSAVGVLGVAMAFLALRGESTNISATPSPSHSSPVASPAPLAQRRAGARSATEDAPVEAPAAASSFGGASAPRGTSGPLAGPSGSRHEVRPGLGRRRRATAASVTTMAPNQETAKSAGDKEEGTDAPDSASSGGARAPSGLTSDPLAPARISRSRHPDDLVNPF